MELLLLKAEERAGAVQGLASRMADRIQLSTDGHKMYEGTVGPSFRHQVDWAQIHLSDHGYTF